MSKSPVLQTSKNDANTATGIKKHLPESARASSRSGHNENEFHFFSRLPVELRLRVWELGLEDVEPRLIVLNRDYKGTALLLKSAPPPTILYANVESRSVGLQRYEPFEIGRNGALVNWEEDTILDLSNTLLQSHKNKEIYSRSNGLFEKCRNYSVPLHLISGTRAPEYRSTYFKRFKTLKFVGFFIPSPSDYYPVNLLVRYRGFQEPATVYEPSDSRRIAWARDAISRVENDDSNTIIGARLVWPCRFGDTCLSCFERSPCQADIRSFCRKIKRPDGTPEA